MATKPAVKLIAGALILTVLVGLCATYRPDRAIHVVTGYVAHNVCSKSFVAGLDPQKVFAETTDRDGVRLLRWGLQYHLDRTGQTVDASLAFVVLAASILFPVVFLLGYGYYDYQRRMTESNDIADRVGKAVHGPVEPVDRTLEPAGHRLLDPADRGDQLAHPLGVLTE